MDDIYENLENYNDVNVVEELKSENKELKIKLGEYSSAMGQLQKDFDKLNSEYKKLEKNYSSLLKTARAEIERKTETIKNLNTEKDMLIIKTLKETGNVLNFRRKRSFSNEAGHKMKKTTDAAVSNDKQNKDVSLENNQEKNDKRGNSSHTPSIDTFSSLSAENKSTCSEEKQTKNVNNYEIIKNKENVSKVLSKDDSTNRHREKIMNRRKSVPVMSPSEPKFSSDEDIDKTKIDSIRRSPLRIEPKHYERHDFRTTEPYGYDTYKEPYRNKPNNYTGYNKYRNADNYVSHQKHWRNYSPERNQQRYSKEYSDNYHLRADYKQRVLRSPPSDKYKRSKSRDRRNNCNQNNYSDFDKHSNQYHDNYVVRHKIRHDFDEPSSKRQKIATNSRDAMESNNYVHEKVRRISERSHVLPPQEFIELSSCQSPDYVNVDSVSQPHVKEIMNTAAIKLDDPRISSKKYFLKTCNNIYTLVAVAGRDIDLKTIDSSVWGIQKFDMPEALLKPINDQGTENILKGTDMEVDNIDLNESLESGVVRTIINDAPTLNSKINDKDVAIQRIDENENSDNRANVCDGKEKVDNTERPEILTKFKIPNIKKPDKSDKDKELDNQDTCVVKKTVTNIKNVKKSSSLRDSKVNSKTSDAVKNSDLPIIQNMEDIDSGSGKICMKKLVNKNNTIENSDFDKATHEIRRQEIIRTIEGDLELSDEASDIMESYKDGDKNSSENQIKATSTNDCSKENNHIVTSSNSNSTKENIPKVSTSEKKSKKDSKETSKRRKSKLKTSEQKETNSKQHIEEADVAKLENNDKTTKQNVSKQTLTKFSDLFGDSSSLITLDDLGVKNLQVQPATKYTPIFENTQDAVDLSVEDIAKAQTKMQEIDILDHVPKKVNDNENDKINLNVNVTVVNGIGENNVDDKDPSLNEVYENTTAETTTDSPNVFKTVIISSGIQPESAPDRYEVKDNIDVAIQPSVLPIIEGNHKKCPLNSIKALATSTPQKCIENVVSGLQKGTLCTSIINKPTDDSASSNMSNSSNPNNTEDIENEDLPDIRIIVKRKRKIIRRT